VYIAHDAKGVLLDPPEKATPESVVSFSECASEDFGMGTDGEHLPPDLRDKRKEPVVRCEGLVLTVLPLECLYTDHVVAEFQVHKFHCSGDQVVMDLVRVGICVCVTLEMAVSTEVIVNG